MTLITQASAAHVGDWMHDSDPVATGCDRSWVEGRCSSQDFQEGDFEHVYLKEGPIC